jgi:AcrR family transcriptional regulator
VSDSSTGMPVGRPRSGGRMRPGATPREEILDAAAELFTTRGYAATSTRSIAEAVGIRQASMYYHFARKEDLLRELLGQTVAPSLEHADELIAGRLPADEALYRLAHFDCALLLAGPWNLGSLYLVPEVRSPEFAPFWETRDRLRDRYAGWVAQAAPAGRPVAETAVVRDLVLGLVESVIAMRSLDPGLDTASIAPAVAAGCLLMAGVDRARIDALAALVAG